MAQLKEGSVIKKPTGDEVIATVNDIPTKVGQLQNDKNYVTQSDLGEAGLGDMTKGVYDTNNNGKVDKAELADSVAMSGVIGLQDALNNKQDSLGFTPENTSKKGAANGYASLDANKKVPLAQLPSMGIGQEQLDGHIDNFIPHGKLNCTTSLTYNANGEVTQIDVKQESTLRVRTTLSYSGDKLISSNVKQYAENGSTVIAEYTDTISYSGEEISGVTRAVV
ncbi:MAG TPA: hypothetical protein VFD57_06510 [Clostridia bacterium]|nr:hypothetical protein [Clostridia bacterium]